jgi:hypothetical protein
MISLILYDDNDSTIDKTIMGMMEGIFPSSTTLIKYHYVEYLVETIDKHLCKFHTYRLFRYQFYLVYFILYYQTSYFEHLNLIRLND